MLFDMQDYHFDDLGLAYRDDHKRWADSPWVKRDADDDGSIQTTILIQTMTDSINPVDA